MHKESCAYPTGSIARDLFYLETISRRVFIFCVYCIQVPNGTIFNKALLLTVKDVVPAKANLMRRILKGPYIKNAQTGEGGYKCSLLNRWSLTVFKSRHPCTLCAWNLAKITLIFYLHIIVIALRPFNFQAFPLISLKCLLIPQKNQSNFHVAPNDHWSSLKIICKHERKLTTYPWSGRSPSSQTSFQ